MSFGSSAAVQSPNVLIPRIASTESSLSSLGGSVSSLRGRVVQHFNTIAEAVADEAIINGDKVIIKERGSGLFDVVLASTVTPNTANIVQCVSVPTLALVLRVEGHIDFRRFGIVGAGDETSKMQAAFQYGFDNSLAIELDGTKTYTASDVLLDDSTHDSLVIFAKSGRAKINYTGSAIESLINSQELLFMWLENIEITCNDLIATTLDLRNYSTPDNQGGVNIKNVVVKDVKQTTQSKSAAGIQVLGEFKNANINNNKVINVSRTNPALACYGIGISDFTGIADVSGNYVENVSTPDDKDADGILVFGNEVSTPTAVLSAQAAIYNNTVKDCQGRFIKIQASNTHTYGNVMSLSDGFTTITDWRGVDIQSNNGNTHDNTMNFGLGVTFGSASAMYVVQNIRNDGRAKSNHTYKNRCSSKSNIETMFSALSKNGDSTFVFDDNDFIGAAVSHMVKLDVDLVTTDTTNMCIKNNKATEVLSNLFDPFRDADHGVKLYLEIDNNENLKMNNVNLYEEGRENFSVNSNFRIRNNTGFKQRVNWVFDMDSLLSGNAFITGAQVVTSRPLVLPNYFHVISDGYIQRCIETLGSAEYLRTSTNGSAWNAWSTV